MKDVIYMLGVVAVGFAVNYALRALPFVLFAGRDRELPRWVERFGALVSPVIIAGLIVYSYSGLEWKTVYPYLAGAIVIGLQVWKRNPLVSIVAGTVLYMAFLNCGCTTHRSLELDARHPAVRVSTRGVLFGDELVRPQEVPEILEDYDVPHDRVIHIRLDPDVKDLRPATAVRVGLARAGYTRSILVTERHAESINLGKPKKTSVSGAVPAARPAQRVIRYKQASE